MLEHRHEAKGKNKNRETSERKLQLKCSAKSLTKTKEMYRQRTALFANLHQLYMHLCLKQLRYRI